MNRYLRYITYSKSLLPSESKKNILFSELKDADIIVRILSMISASSNVYFCVDMDNELFIIDSDKIYFEDSIYTYWKPQILIKFNSIKIQINTELHYSYTYTIGWNTNLNVVKNVIQLLYDQNNEFYDIVGNPIPDLPPDVEV